MADTFLKDETRFLRSVIYGLSEGVIVADLGGRFLLFNPSAEKMLGIGSREIPHEKWTEAYGCYMSDKTTPYPAELLPLSRAIMGEEVKNEPIFIKNPQKPEGVWISVSGRPLREEDGKIWGGLVIFRDITAHKLAEESSHSSSLRLKAFVENQETAILVENEKRQIQLINKAFCNLFGIQKEPAELMGRDYSHFAQHAKSLVADSEGFTQRLKELIENRAIVTNERLQLMDGRVYERDYVPVYAGNKSRGHVWQYRDATQREKARKEIKLMERLSRALEQIADSVVITDTRGRIEYVNQAFETTTGFSQSEALGKTPNILKSGMHDTGFYRNLWNEIKAGRTYRGTIINRKKNGEPYWSEQSISPIKDDDGNITHYVSVLKDITELLQKKEREIEMRLARDVQEQYYGNASTLPGFEIAGDTRPADETGGDYFDFIKLPNGCLAVVIGDVSGHGISSALIMAEMRAYLRSFATSCSDIGTILTKTNQMIEKDLDKGRFITLLMMCIDPQRRMLQYSSAGHEYGYLLNKSGDLGFVFESTGPPLGIFPDTQYSASKSLHLEGGQIIVLITDGVSDLMAGDDSELLAVNVIDFVNSHRHEPAEQIAGGLCANSYSHAKNSFIRMMSHRLSLK